MSYRLLMAAPLLLLAAFCACDSEPHPSDAELRLTPAQIHGRRIFEARCSECHTAYSSHDRRGPSLEGVFKKRFMPSGTPANDERVRDVIMLGRAKMPAYGRVFSSDDLDALLSYLHTL